MPNKTLADLFFHALKNRIQIHLFLEHRDGDDFIVMERVTIADSHGGLTRLQYALPVSAFPVGSDDNTQGWIFCTGEISEDVMRTLLNVAYTEWEDSSILDDICMGLRLPIMDHDFLGNEEDINW